MNDPKTHVDTHPSGHPNKTAVNAENPIFGRPADPIPAVSLQQAAVVQSEKHPRETVQSPLLHEDAAGPVPVAEEPVVENTEALPEQSAEEVAAVSAAEESSEDADEEDFDDDIDDEKDDDEDKQQAAGDQAEAPQDSSPSAEDLDAVAAETAAKEATTGDEETPTIPEESRFAVGQKVRFTPESGNDTEPVYTIKGWLREPGEESLLFWELEEMSGLFLGRNLMPAGLSESSADLNHPLSQL